MTHPTSATASYKCVVLSTGSKKTPKEPYYSIDCTELCVFKTVVFIFPDHFSAATLIIRSLFSHETITFCDNIIRIGHDSLLVNLTNYHL